MNPVQEVVENLHGKTVVEYLNETNYGHDPDYVPSNFALEFVAFIKLVNGVEGEENLTPIVHYRMLDTIVHGLAKDGKVKKGNKSVKIANLCHRGIAKTTLMGEYLLLYIAVYNKLPGFGKINHILYVSDSIENGVKNMRKNLEYRWEKSEFLQKYLPEETTRFTDIRWQFINVAGETTIIKGYGAKTGVRGTKELGTRPQLAILDDLVSDEDARSDTVIASIEATVHKALNYALHPKRNMIIWSGTPFNARDPLYKAVESGAWTVNVFPICEEFPCSKEDFRGSWPDRFTYEYVKDQYEKAHLQKKVDAFNQELMLRIMSDDDRLILDNDICWYNRASILNHRDSYNFYITTDFATSEKQKADFSVISVWAYNSNGDWFWVDGICKRQTMDKTVDDLFKFAQIYKPQSVGIEVSGQQGGFISWIQSLMLDRRIFFNLASDNNSNAPGIRPNGKKLVRFNTVLPLFKAKKMFFPQDLRDTPEMKEMYNELSLISPGGFKSKHDDFTDTISMLSCLQTWRPSDDVPVPVNDPVYGRPFWDDDDDEYSGKSAMSSYLV